MSLVSANVFHVTLLQLVDDVEECDANGRVSVECKMSKDVVGDDDVGRALLACPVADCPSPSGLFRFAAPTCSLAVVANELFQEYFWNVVLNMGREVGSVSRLLSESFSSNSGPGFEGQKEILTVGADDVGQLN